MKQGMILSGELTSKGILFFIQLSEDGDTRKCLVDRNKVAIMKEYDMLPRSGQMVNIKIQNDMITGEENTEWVRLSV